MPGSEPLVGGAILAGTGLGWGFLRWVTRQIRADEERLSDHKDAELTRLQSEIERCRAESATMNVKFGMLVGLARRNGWTIPPELLS